MLVGIDRLTPSLETFYIPVPLNINRLAIIGPMYSILNFKFIRSRPQKEGIGYKVFQSLELVILAKMDLFAYRDDSAK